MSQKIRFLTIVVFFQLFFAGMIQAQVKVIEKPAPEVGPDDTAVYTWISSWGLRDDPRDKYPLGTATHKTKSEAVAAANAHIARTAGNGSEAVTHYLIVGEPSVRPKLAVRAEKTKEVLDKVKQAKQAVEKAIKDAAEDGSSSFRRALRTSERQLADVINEYKNMISESYKQATEAKKTLTGDVSTQTKEKLKQVNDLIDQYNRDLDDFRAVMGKDYDLGFSSLDQLQEPKNETDVSSDPSRELVGTWFWSHSGGGFTSTRTVTINADGTGVCKRTSTSQYGENDERAFKWTYSGPKSIFVEWTSKGGGSQALNFYQSEKIK